jgi:hypothetical protein
LNLSITRAPSPEKKTRFPKFKVLVVNEDTDSKPADVVELEDNTLWVRISDIPKCPVWIFSHSTMDSG